MDSAIWIIILGIWIWMLQSRVNALEKTVRSMAEKNSKPIESQSESVSVPDEVTDIEFSAVETFRQAHNDTGAITKEEKAQEMIAVDAPLSSESKEPSFFTKLLVNYFTGGNLLVRIGGVVLFFGLAFLVKYAAEHSIISIQMRLGAVAVAAVALIGAGWRLRAREGAYGQILQGLGVAILYLVIFASAKFYALFSLESAFMMMLGVVVIGSFLAVKEDSLPLALFATSGGFLVPILTSTGEGSHVVLFSYYALLNLGVFAVAWYRSWRALNVAGFVFTFVIATVWGVLRYRSEIFATTEPFLLLYFTMYLGISILFTVKHPYEPKNLVDGTLVFGLPVVAFPLQLQLVAPFAYGDAYSAAALGALYTGLYVLLRGKERTDLLSRSFLALGVVFLTISIPYIFDADVSAVLWSLESAGIIWIALKQGKPYTRYFGELLLFVSMLLYPVSVQSGGIDTAEYLGFLILILALLSGSYLLDSHKNELGWFDRLYARVLLIADSLYWFVSTPTQLEKFALLYDHVMVYTLVAGALVLFALSKALAWRLSANALQGYLILGMLFFQVDMALSSLSHPFEAYGALAFGLLIGLNYVLLYAFDSLWRYAKGLHVLSLWFVAAVLMMESRYWAVHLGMGEMWMLVFIAAVPMLFSFALLALQRYPEWLERYRAEYQLMGAGGMVAVLMVWELRAFGAFWETGLPLFNPLDMMQLIGLGAVWYWSYRNKGQLAVQTQMMMYGITAAMGTILASVVFARAVHHYRGVVYQLDILWQDLYFQAGLSILWSLIAIVVMLLSKRYENRWLWMGGFGLLSLVVLKLFFIELANSGTVERIISFIVVGSLLLLIGYFVPLPPDTKHMTAEDKNNDNL